MTYSLLDSGNGRKLERFGNFLISRPCSQAVWKPLFPETDWRQADAVFLRENDIKWTFHNPKASSTWAIEISGIFFKISPTDFGHLGIFPEQQDSWKWIFQNVAKAVSAGRSINILNLFAYSGGATLAAAKAGANVCHLDASKGMVEWARENALLNQLEDAPIRWIVDDVRKFLQREMRRERKYDGIILDPPTFGRGTKGEVFKIEDHIQELLHQCRMLLSQNPLFILFSCHTPGFSPIVMKHLLTQMMSETPGKIQEGEMLLQGDDNVFSVPSGTYARWLYES